MSCPVYVSRETGSELTPENVLVLVVQIWLVWL